MNFKSWNCLPFLPVIIPDLHGRDLGMTEGSLFLTLYVLNFSEGTWNMYLHFMSFHHIDVTQLVEILPQIRQEPTYSTQSISWLLMSWRCKGGWVGVGTVRGTASDEPQISDESAQAIFHQYRGCNTPCTPWHVILDRVITTLNCRWLNREEKVRHNYIISLG